MASEWPRRPLAEISMNFDTQRKPVKEAERVAGPYPYYGASGIVDYVDGYLFNGEYLLVAEDGENLRTRNTPIAFRATGKFWVNNHAHILQGNDEASTRYLNYALLAADITPYLTGAVMPKLTQGNLNKIELPCPPPEMQDEIAGVLGALDDRIDNLRQTNATLQAIAAALFKSRFVDFDGVPQEHMQESELGLIPKGWRLGTLANLCELKYGKALKATERREGEIPVYGSGGITGYHDEALVTKPTIIVGRKGTVGALYWQSASCFPIDTVFYVEPKVSLNFCYYAMMRMGLHHLNTDAAVPGLNRDNAYRQPVVIPSDEALEEWDVIASSLRAQMDNADQQTATLAALRDTLLPRLISGRLRVNP